MIPKRNLMAFLLPIEHLAMAHRGVRLERPRDMPEDAEPLHGHWSARHGAFEIVYYSPSFDEIPVGMPIPYGNAPVLSEVPK